MRKVISATRDNESINIKTIFLQHQSFHRVVFPVDLYRLFRSIQRISITGTIEIYIYSSKRIKNFFLISRLFIQESGMNFKVKRKGGAKYRLLLICQFISPRRFNAKLETRRCLVTSRFPPLEETSQPNYSGDPFVKQR